MLHRPEATESLLEPEQSRGLSRTWVHAWGERFDGATSIIYCEVTKDLQQLPYLMLVRLGQIPCIWACCFTRMSSCGSI
jgi:hypothetical protein